MDAEAESVVVEGGQRSSHRRLVSVVIIGFALVDMGPRSVVVTDVELPPPEQRVPDRVLFGQAPAEQTGPPQVRA